MGTKQRITHHRKGDVLPIYQKPYTKEELEGTAKLVRFIVRDEDTQMERWIVHFEGDDEGACYQRFIRD